MELEHDNEFMKMELPKDPSIASVLLMWWTSALEKIDLDKNGTIEREEYTILVTLSSH